MKKNDQPIGLLIAELSGDKAIILFMKVQSEQEEQLLSAFLQVLEKVLSAYQIKCLFCFHPDTETISHAFHSASWSSSTNQYEYVISAERPAKYNLSHFFQIVEWNEADARQLYKKESFMQDALPPIEVVNPATSYLLLAGDKLAGWFVAVKHTHPTVLSIARFYMEKEYREVKISVPFLKRVLYQNYEKMSYDTIICNIVESQKKLITIIDKEYLGSVREKKIIMRSYKIIK